MIRTTIVAISLAALPCAALLQDGAPQQPAPQKPAPQKPAPEKPAAERTAPQEFHGLERPKPVPDGRVAKLEDLGGYACAQCHTEVADEWAETTHALAWVDPLYQQEIALKRRPEACHGCHIPEPLHLGPIGSKPEPRKDSKDDPWRHGVSCESCHAGPDGTILGPWGHATPAHRSKVSETMVGAGSTALCLSCHKINIGPVLGVGKDFEKSEQAARGRSCVGCHWAPVERAWANPPPGEASSEAVAAGAPAVRKGRSHATQTPRDPAFLRRAFDAKAKVAGGKTVILLQNTTGHRVPGLIGRSFEFTATVLDAGGKVLGEAKRTFDTESHLPVDQTVEFPVGAVGAQVRLVGLHHDPRLEKPVTFLDVELAPAGQ